MEALALERILQLQQPAHVQAKGCSLHPARKGLFGNETLVGEMYLFAGGCQYSCTNWYYFSLTWFLSNMPEEEISEQNKVAILAFNSRY